MSAIAARSAAFPTRLAHSETSLQVAALFAMGNGWISVWYCDGNPTDKHSNFTAYSWRQAKNLHDITEDIEHCAAHYGDGYLSLTQHREPRRQERTALPCPWLWLDDVKDLSLVLDAALVLAWRGISLLISHQSDRSQSQLRAIAVTTRSGGNAAARSGTT